METLGDKNLPKFCSKYCCEYCDYNTCKKSSYNSHLASERHKKRAFGDIGDKNSAKILPSDKKMYVKFAKKHICLEMDYGNINKNVL